MSKFKTKNLSNEDIIGIIDVGSYKVRVAICSFSTKIKLLGFAEKRQSNLDIENYQIKNLEGICENISIALKKAETEAGLKVKNIAINPVFTETFFSSKKLIYSREDKYKLISKKELENIINYLEKKHYLLSTNEINKNYLHSASNLEIIVSNISNIKIDDEPKEELLKNTGKIISMNLLNIFISKNNIELLNYIANYTKKNLIKILPEEFCLSKIWDKKKEIVIINIGNSSSYITIKDAIGSILGSIKINVGIENLIKKIQKEVQISRTEVIKKLNKKDFFPKLKNEFLNIYIYLLSQAIYEIMRTKPVPSNFFLIGGGGNNLFLKKAIEKYDFSKYLRINKKLKFIIPNVSRLGKIENVETILNKSNLNIIAMILTMGDIIKHEKDYIEKILQKTIKEIVKN